MFRRILHGTVVVVIMVYVDDLLVASATKRDEEQAVRDLCSCFSIKDLGEASYYLGCHITRDRNAGDIEVRPASVHTDCSGAFRRDEDQRHPVGGRRKSPFEIRQPANGRRGQINSPDSLPRDRRGPNVGSADDQARHFIRCASTGKIQRQPGADTVEGSPEGAAIFMAHSRPGDHLRRRTGGGGTKLSAWIDADYGTCPDTRRSVSERSCDDGWRGH